MLAENVFVEKVLPGGDAAPADRPRRWTRYRAPYREPGESRRPTLTWPREIPIDGEPADVHEIVARNAQWMASSPVPKLFVNGDPGALLTGPLREQCRRWPAQEEVTVPGLHFLPEDSAPAIADALDAWLGALGREGAGHPGVLVRPAAAARPCGRPTRASRTAPRGRGRRVGGPARRRD